MSDKSNKKSVQPNQNAQDLKPSNDFVVGLVTFVAFLVFMTTWMYYSV